MHYSLKIGPALLAAILSIAPSCAVCAGSVLVLNNVNVVPATEELVVEDVSVLILDGRITAIGPAERLDIPQGAQLIDGRGGFVAPGLTEMHEGELTC